MRGHFPLLVRFGVMVSLVTLVSACAHQQPASVAPAGPQPVLINTDYQAGRVEFPETAVPSLEQIINRAPAKSSSKPATNEDRLRGPAVRDAALSYGAQAGLAWESRAINDMLQTKSADISRTYDFQRVMIKGPDNVMILPPVISQLKETWETSEAGKTLRVADTMYEIVEQATFAPTAPLWQTYLLRTYQSPAAPPDMLLPRDGGERNAWKAAVVEGWNKGREQAQQIFQADIERLERDFTGMVRYKALLEEGKVSAPVVADARFGTTGTGQDMRVNDRAIRITQDPSLQVGQPQDWQASPTTEYPNGQTTGNDPSLPPPQCPEGTTPAAKQVSSQLVCVSAPVPHKRPAAQPSGDRAAWSSF